MAKEKALINEDGIVVVALPEKDKLPPERVAEEIVMVPTSRLVAASEEKPVATPDEVMPQVPEVKEREVVFSEPRVMVLPAAVRFPEVEMPWEKSP